MVILALTGDCGVGKSTFAEAFCRKYRFVELRFSYKLYKLYCHLFNIDEARLLKDYNFKCQHRNGLRKLADEIKAVNYNYFVDQVERQIVAGNITGKETNFIISDLRFLNERDMLQKYGVFILELGSGNTEYEIGQIVADVVLDLKQCSDINQVVANYFKYFKLPFPYKKFMPTKFADGVPNQAVRRLMFNLIKNNNFSQINPENKIIEHEKNEYDVNILVDYYTEHARVVSSLKQQVTLFDFWNKNQEIILREKHNKPIREYLYSLKLEPTNFKISLAKCLYEYVGATKIYNPCMGWGEKMIGAACLSGVTHYTGVDANADLATGYEEIKTDLLLDRAVFRTEIADVFGWRPDFDPDCILISPPYFDFELYGTVELPYRDNIIDWTYKWLIPLMKQLYNILADGGHLIVYIQPTGRYNYVEKLIEEMPPVHDKLYSARLNNSPLLGILIWKK